jgi:hypothetical protein
MHGSEGREWDISKTHSFTRLPKPSVVAVVLEQSDGIRYLVVLTLSVRQFLKVIGGAIADNKREQFV